ncbi:hypothetical protein Tco_0949397 [Tanacetum coccineum]
MDVKTAFLNGDLDGESKFDETGKGVIICLYVDDMLIFGTDQVQVDLTKEFLSSSCFDFTPISTPMDTSKKLMPNNGQAVSQLVYSRVIGCLMYTSNPRTQHWQAIQRVLKYLKKTMDYKLTYTGYPSMLEGYTDASWISNTEDNSSTSGGVFLLAAGKKAEWLRNLILEIPLWYKPIAPISVCCDSVATLAKAYSQMSQRNLADHLTKGLARDLVLKSAEGMGLKSNQVIEC